MLRQPESFRTAVLADTVCKTILVPLCPNPAEIRKVAESKRNYVLAGVGLGRSNEGGVEAVVSTSRQLPRSRHHERRARPGVFLRDGRVVSFRRRIKPTLRIGWGVLLGAFAAGHEASDRARRVILGFPCAGGVAEGTAVARSQVEGRRGREIASVTDRDLRISQVGVGFAGIRWRCPALAGHWLWSV